MAEFSNRQSNPIPEVSSHTIAKVLESFLIYREVGNLSSTYNIRLKWSFMI